MFDKIPIEIVWTKNSLITASTIKKYLQVKFSEKEVNNFFSLLKTFEEAVSFFPELYPVSKNKVRRAVLNKNLSVFYRKHKKRIEILAVLDNRMDLSEWME
jgi:plasmid stabilization system protein ParE